MLVMILECVPSALRGELTRWLIEPHTGVFVGHVSALVRDRLWEKCVFAKLDGGVVQIWSTNTEQRFEMRMVGHTQRQLRDFDGLQLVCVPHVASNLRGRLSAPASSTEVMRLAEPRPEPLCDDL